jgi:bacterioferritin-associated ferredoxin
MAPVFIFARSVQKLIQEGAQEIEIPEGGRISAAAADLIKENKIRIKIISPGAAAPAAAPPVTEKPTEQPSAARPEDQPAPAPASEPITTTDSPVAEMTDAVVEDIVNRVIARFRQLRESGGRKQATTDSRPAEAAPSPAPDDDLVICRCEEITRGEIKEAIRSGMRSLNGIKRVTRAGMGLCQGQTCQRLVSQILAKELGLGLAEVEPTTARGPVRPLKMQVFANS